MADFLFELRTEELPPRDVERATHAMAASLAACLAEAGLAPQSTSAAWTPRRMAVWAHGLPERSPDRQEDAKGPPENVAFDAAGAPTRAAVGFAQRCGVALEDLRREDGRVTAVVRTPGRPAVEILRQVLPALPAAVPWRKTMRWPQSSVSFARPIRGVVALLGPEIVECVVGGLSAGRETRGHPFLSPRTVEIASADRGAYVDAMRAACVLADPDERRTRIEGFVRAADPGADVDPSLLDEVVNLVEWPTALVGRFDPAYLELPPRLLTTVMAHHQRFFPVRDGTGHLGPRFVAVLDRDEASVAVSRPGFERVLIPRLHDARFFMAQDRKRPLADRLSALEDVVYHRKLGSLADKAKRLSALARRVAELLGLDEPVAAAAERAGLLAKCDLVTHLVGEFPELQGHVGAVYARADGEPDEVAQAVDSQYRHRFGAEDSLQPAAVVLLLAECLDVLASFGTKVKLPSGNADPFGVRRAALTLLEVASRWARDLPLRAALETAGGSDEVWDYLVRRLVLRLRDQGHRPDHVDAVMGTVTTLGGVESRLADLEGLAGRPSFPRLLEVAERCRNITRKADGAADRVSPDLLQEPAEKALFEAWRPLRDALPAAPSALAGGHAAALADGLATPLHRFFEEVFVNADDEAVRGNRLALLCEIDRAFLRFADLCAVSAK